MKTEIKQRIAQLNNGEVPSGYKKTSVGIVPNEWTEHTLGDIFKFKNGLNKEKEAFGQGTPIVNYTDVWKKRGLRAKDIKGRVALSEKEIQAYEAKAGDVFFTRTSETIDEIGYSSVLLEDVENAVFSGFILRARPYNDLVCREYHQYCYSEPLMRQEIIKRSSMTTRALTSGPMLSQVAINLPSQREQSKLAEILMKWDEAIELQEAYLELILFKKSYLIKHLMMPQKHWISIEMQAVGELYQPMTISESDLTDTGYTVYGANGEIGFYHTYNHEQSEIAITCRGSTCGQVTFTKPKSWITGNAMVFKVDENKFDKNFLYYYCCSLGFKKIISGSGQPQIIRQAFQKFLFHIPADKSEQRKIANLLVSVDEYVNVQTEKLNILKKQRKTLQQYLLNGIVRV